MKRLGIFGTSGHAREVGDIAWALGYEPVYVAHGPADVADWDFPEEVILEADVGKYDDIEFAIGIGDNGVRETVAQRHAGRLRFANLVHPDASFGHRQREALAASVGLVVCAGARLSNHIEVGDFSIFNRNSTVGHDTIVEAFVHLAPCACVSGNVHLGRGSWIGAGAVVNEGAPGARLAIGAGCVVGSGAVVIGDCAEAGVYAGVPAKRIR